MLRLRVKEVAEAKGYNMSSLSRKADISFNTVRRIFHQPYRSTSTYVLQRIAEALRVDVSDLLEMVPDEQAKAEMAHRDEDDEDT
jgi:DNA-binding Xre family transcriptional regulator